MDILNIQMSVLLGVASAVDICVHDVVDYFIVISFRFSHGEFAKHATYTCVCERARQHIENIRKFPSNEELNGRDQKWANRKIQIKFETGTKKEEEEDNKGLANVRVKERERER